MELLQKLQGVYGDFTENTIHKVVNLHHSLNGAMLLPDPKMSYPSFETNSFLGVSGKKYIVRGTLNSKQFQQLESLMLQIDLGQVDIETFLTQMNNAINASDLALLGNLTHQFQQSMAIKKNMPELVMLCCSLFMVAENDNREWDASDAHETIKDWQNIPYSFFLAALNCFRVIFIETSRQGFQNTLRIQAQIQAKESRIASFFSKFKKRKIG